MPLTTPTLTRAEHSGEISASVDRVIQTPEQEAGRPFVKPSRRPEVPPTMPPSLHTKHVIDGRQERILSATHFPEEKTSALLTTDSGEFPQVTEWDAKVQSFGPLEKRSKDYQTTRVVGRETTIPTLRDPEKAFSRRLSNDLCRCTFAMFCLRSWRLLGWTTFIVR